MSAGARALRAILSLYQRWSVTRPPRCRFLPTCSAYAHEAVGTHGVGRGVWLATRRLVRCRPGGGFGYDPVPPARAWLTEVPGGPPPREDARVG